MTPQKVLPDKLKEEELFVYENDTLEKKETPENMEVCESSATFLSIYEMHDPGAIIHCANNSVLISAFQCREDEFRIKNHSMIKVTF